MSHTSTTRRARRGTPNTASPRRTEAVAPVPPGRHWTMTTPGGPTVRGYLPGWAEDDPSRTDVPPHALRNAVYDVIHRASFDGQLVRLAQGGYGPGESTWTLGGNIECVPDNDGQPSLPVVNIHLIEDFWLSGLDPAELSVFAGQLRSQADRLENDIRARLIAYRADWVAHHRRTGRQRPGER